MDPYRMMDRPEDVVETRLLALEKSAERTRFWRSLAMFSAFITLGTTLFAAVAMGRAGDNGSTCIDEVKVAGPRLFQPNANDVIVTTKLECDHPRHHSKAEREPSTGIVTLSCTCR